MSNKSIATIATMGIDIGKNSFHVVGLDQRGAIVLRQKWSRGQIEARIANMPPCLIGMEACVGAHHLSRKLQAHGHDARLMPAKYVRAYSRGQKNDFRDAEAIAEAVQRPTMKFVATKTADSSTCRRCTGCASGWSGSAPASSMRFVRSCWSAELRCARGCAFCVPNCRASLPCAPTSYRRA
jgi:Transposase